MKADSVVGDLDGVASALDDAAEFGRAVNIGMDEGAGTIARVVISKKIQRPAADVVFRSVLGGQPPAGDIVFIEGGTVAAILQKDLTAETAKIFDAVISLRL